MTTFHTKLDKTLTKLDLKECSSDAPPGYVKIFSSFVWLLFIDSKNTILNKSTTDILSPTCIMAHIISTLLFLAWDYMRPEALKCSPKDKSIAIKEKLLEMFCIKDLAEYKERAKEFEEHFGWLRDKGIIKNTPNKMDILSPEHINTNYKRLDRHYEKNLNPDDLDERVFFRERAMNLTPSKFTPFARQGYANKYQKPALSGKISGNANKDQHFNSHRILNYEVIEKEIENRNMPAHEIKLPKSIMQSPSMVKVPLLCATPITAGMEMYNYLKQKSWKFKDMHSQVRPFDKNVVALIDRVFDLEDKNMDQKSKDLKKNMILPLYKVISDEYFAANTFESDTTPLMKAFLALSIELIFFVSNINFSFEEIEDTIEIEPFEMWKVIDYFLKSDKAIPSPLKLHLLDLEVNFISFKLWKNRNMTKLLCSMANRTASNLSDSQYSTAEKLFKRTVHQIAFQITRLTTLLNIEESTAEFIFDTMKETISLNIDFLFNRHIDQLIICAIFANSKSDGYDIKFNDIKQYYMDSNPNLKEILDDIICNVYVGEGEAPKDVIKFYNDVYIKTNEIKEYILSLRRGNQARHNSKKNPILMSPMKAIIPKEINFRPKNRQLKGNITPNTQLLVAYNESPFMKYDHQNSFKGPLKSKKLINFDEEEEKVNYSSKPSEEEKAPPEQHEATNNFISKRCNPVLIQSSESAASPRRKTRTRAPPTPTALPWTSTRRTRTRPTRRPSRRCPRTTPTASIALELCSLYQCYAPIGDPPLLSVASLIY